MMKGTATGIVLLCAVLLISACAPFRKDVFQLAERVPKESHRGETMHGLFFDNVSDSILNVVLRVLSAAGKSILTAEELDPLTSDSEYRHIWSSIMKAYRTGTVFQRNENVNPYTLFDEGRIAMIYGNEATMGRFSPDTRWSITAQPHFSALTYHEIMSISETSTQKEAAWEIVKLLNSTEQAARYRFGGLPISRSVAERFYDLQLIEPFYQLPLPDNRSATGQASGQMDAEFFRRLIQAYEDIINEMIADNMTVDEAMERLRALR